MVFLFIKALLLLSSFLLRSWSNLSSPFLFWHYWCRYSWLEINVISMWGKMKMLYWIKSDRIEVWRSLSRKNNTSGAQVSLMEKREHLQWKEQRKRDTHWITYSKESIKEPQKTGNYLQRAFFAQLGEFPCWWCVSAPHISTLWPALFAVCLLCFALEDTVPIRKGRLHTTQPSPVNMCIVFMTDVFLLWRNLTFIKNLELFNVMPKHQKQHQGLLVIYTYLKMQTLIWTN